MIFNDEELRSNDEEITFRRIKDDVQELMRSGYYEVEKVWESNEGIPQDSNAIQA